MIREAAYSDIYDVGVMAKNFENHTVHVKVDPGYTALVYWRHILKGTGVVFVIEREGQIVGGLGGIKGPDLHYPRIIAVETFWFVLPEHRGEGLKLMEKFEQWAVDQKCDAVAMVHLSDSQPKVLEKIYARKGYSLVEKHYLKVLI